LTGDPGSPPLASILKTSAPSPRRYQGHVIMQDDIVPVVHPGNPVSELTWQQLADIHSGKITNWKDVGGPDQPIVVVTSQPTAATRIVFQETVMGGATYVAGAREVQSTRQEVELVEKMKGGVGAVSEAFVKMNPGKVKVVKTKPITRPLLVVTKGKPDPEVEKVLAFLKTPKAKALFQ
jgi:phosphate transport system substrate-binding protein